MEPLLQWNNSEILGEGAYGTVFKGSFNGKNVAVKKVNKEYLRNINVIEREEAALIELDHPNIVKLLHVKNDGAIKYFVLEFCEANIYQFFENHTLKNEKHYFEKQYTGPVPTNENALLQMADGLNYIHGKNFIHRDLSPKNILISQTSSNSAILKLSDFGLCKPTSANGSFSLGSNIQGVEGFVAPELLRVMEKQDISIVTEERGNRASDIFALGCLFYMYLTKGYHPFQNDGGIFSLELNIIVGQYSLRIEENHFAYEAIKGMIKNDPDERWTLDRVRTTLNNSGQN